MASHHENDVRQTNKRRARMETMWTVKIQGLSHRVVLVYFAHTEFPFCHFLMYSLHIFIVCIEKNMYCVKAKLCMLQPHIQWNILVKANKKCDSKKIHHERQHSVDSNVDLQWKCNCLKTECHAVFVWPTKMKMKEKQSCTFVVIAVQYVDFCALTETHQIIGRRYCSSGRVNRS